MSLNKKISPEVIENQRFSGKVIIICALVIVVVYGIPIIGGDFASFSFKKALGRAALYAIASLILMLPAFLAALWQFLAKPGFVSSFLRWIGYGWVLFQALFGMLFLVFLFSFG